MRILRNPDAEASGGGDAVAETKPPVVATRPNPPSAESIADAAELRALRADKAQREAEAKVKADAELKERGRYEELLKSREDELAKERAEKADFEKRTKKSVLDRELAVALSGQNLRPGAAKHLTRLLADDLEVVPDLEGGYAVRSKDRRAITDFIADTLKLPEYDSFIASTARSGVTQTGGSRSAPTPEAPADDVEVKNLGEAIIAEFKKIQSTRPKAVGRYG